MLSLPGLRLMEKTTAWTREGENVGKYRIVMVEMGKVIVESGRKTLVLAMLEGTQFEVKQ